MLRPSSRHVAMMTTWAAALWMVGGPIAVAEDWPQWMGPGRDNVWREDGLLDAFPAAGPTVLWRTAIAGGYAGPAIAAGRGGPLLPPPFRDDVRVRLQLLLQLLRH